MARLVGGDFARSFFQNIAKFTLAVVILVEAIFLAEHFTWVFRDAVRHDANLLDISLVLLCTGTGIFDLALALAVLVAAYMTLLRMRENREFLALFASGLGPYQLGALVLIASCAALVTGIAGAGIVDPLSRYAQRSILFGTELQSMKKGLTRGEFYYFPDYVVYVTDHAPRVPDLPAANVIDARGSAAANRAMFVYQQIAPHVSRVVTAAQAKLDGPDRKGQIVLELNNFSSHVFADAHPLVGISSAENRGDAAILDDLKGIPHVSMHVRDMSQLMMVDQLLPFGTRGSDAAEQTIFEQLAEKGSKTPDLRATQMRLLAERFSRSLLSFLAPLLALAAISLTSNRTNWFALPLACLALMSVNLACEWLITLVAPQGVAAALLPPFLLCALLAALFAALTIARQSDLVRPQLGRA
jgi:lipopolysaccharide export LptBFGC system permease protein LptF